MEEELLNRHRKEKKDLQAQIQSIKKTCTKGDKKKKKEVSEQIAKLELELDEKHAKELEELKLPEVEKKITIQDDPAESIESENDTSKRLSKAQKRRNKKAAEDREREERILKQEEENENGPRTVENDKIKESLTQKGLELFTIPPDGNCLFCAVNHQLEVTGRKPLCIPELRKLAADYMLEHRDDFLPFMSHDSSDTFTESQYEEYCRTIANTPAWGGQIEIKALSNVLKCPIQVIQAESSPTLQGENFNGPPLVLTYHRHLYGLGEHYNSTLAAKA